jgi:hypothetical protein
LHKFYYLGQNCSYLRSTISKIVQNMFIKYFTYSLWLLPCEMFVPNE